MNVSNINMSLTFDNLVNVWIKFLVLRQQFILPEQCSLGDFAHWAFH